MKNENKEAILACFLLMKRQSEKSSGCKYIGKKMSKEDLKTIMKVYKKQQ
jgi:hypothetical protein